MGEDEIVRQILELIPEIDYTQNIGTISVFETTIRHLGGLLSGKPASSLKSHTLPCRTSRRKDSI